MEKRKKKKKTVGRVAAVLAYVKAPKLTYLIRHPLRGTRNLLALRGAKSLLTSRPAVTTAVAAGVVAAPLVAKALIRKSQD